MDHTAYLSSAGRFTSFSFGDNRIRFRTSDQLIGYRKIKQWDNGYIVVDADYNTLGTVEEYIDLIPVLEDLMFEPKAFLAPIKEVLIRNDESR